MFDKYYTKNSPYYQTGLSDEERAAGYSNEISMLEHGDLSGHVYGADSLLRNFAWNPDQSMDERNIWERRMVNLVKL